MKLTILGCGSSGGVPRIGEVWGDADPKEPKNRRRRCAVLIEQFGPSSEARDMDVAALAEATTNNFFKLFTKVPRSTLASLEGA